jgi:hypothetical protein
MNFNFIKDKTESRDGKTLNITGKKEQDILIRILAECSNGHRQQGTVTYYTELPYNMFAVDILYQ